MKTELGFTRARQAGSRRLRRQGRAPPTSAPLPPATRPGLGFLLDPFACDYNPARDAAQLCAGEAGEGVTGSNADTATCMSLKEAKALEQDLVRRHQRWKLSMPRRAPTAAVRQIARQEAAVVDVHQEHGHRQPDHQRLLRQRCAGAAGRQLRPRCQRHQSGDSDHERLDHRTQQMAGAGLRRPRRRREQERRVAADAVQQSHHRQGGSRQAARSRPQGHRL